MGADYLSSGNGGSEGFEQGDGASVRGQQLGTPAPVPNPPKPKPRKKEECAVTGVAIRRLKSPRRFVHYCRVSDALRCQDPACCATPPPPQQSKQISVFLFRQGGPRCSITQRSTQLLRRNALLGSANRDVLAGFLLSDVETPAARLVFPGCSAKTRAA